MTPSLALQTDRFRDLITQVGIDAIFAAPLVTPGNEWFPDRWGQDFESVRLLSRTRWHTCGVRPAAST